MKDCFKCNQTSEEVRLFDGVYVNESVDICERCALLEGIPIFKLPDTDQLKESETGEGVSSRLRRMSGLNEGAKIEKSLYDELNALDENPKLEKPLEETIQLIDNFHWAIQHERRKHGLNHRQLAEAIGESEMALRLVERNNLPDGYLKIIMKIEQYFSILLVKPQGIVKVREHGDKRIGIEEKEKLEPLELFEPSTLVQKEVSAPLEPLEPFKPEQSDPLNSSGSNESLIMTQEDEMVQNAIRTEHDPLIVKQEKINGEPMRALDFKERKVGGVTIADLKQMQKVIEEDFTQKSAEEVGKEQMEGFGTEEKLQSKEWYNDYVSIKKDNDSGKSNEIIEVKGSKDIGSGDRVPTIDELAKRKGTVSKTEENELLGSDIELEE